jgi:hypothetical protein
VTALVVVDPQPAPTELLSQNTIFFAKVVDDLQLTLVHPSGDGGQHKPEWIQYSPHVGSLSPPRMRQDDIQHYPFATAQMTS